MENSNHSGKVLILSWNGFSNYEAFSMMAYLDFSKHLLVVK